MIADNPLPDGGKYAIVFRGSTQISVVQLTRVVASVDFDLAAAEMLSDILPEAVRLPIRTEDVPLNHDIVCFEYSSTRIERSPGRTHVSFEPYSHRGNVVRAYESEFPETIPTPSLLTSFPALQGASGAPLIARNQPRSQFAVAGMIVANVERHLLPAQVVRIERGSEPVEETRYYLPYGKALARSVLVRCLEGMGIPFTFAEDDSAAEDVVRPTSDN
ncbi:MAG: hypothetical protein ACRD1R_11025 [Acidobacteriota bacterium]